MIAVTRKVRIAMVFTVGILCFFLVWEIFVPKSFGQSAPIIYSVKSGAGQKEIGADLQKEGVIKSRFFFTLYSFVSGNYAKLQAGVYEFSPSMSIARLVNMLAKGDMAKNKVVVIEGWNLDDIAQYLQAENIYSKDDVSAALKKELEGYVFPDTYFVPMGFTPEDFVKMARANFEKKVTPDMRLEIAKQKKTISQIVIMASILEKEVQSVDDKKMVAGILWKRISAGMALQVDAAVSTYDHVGLPPAPICNPGLDSILAAMYPIQSDYWYYLSATATGETIYSKTFKDHSLAIAKYLRER